MKQEEETDLRRRRKVVNVNNARETRTERQTMLTNRC